MDSFEALRRPWRDLCVGRDGSSRGSVRDDTSAVVAAKIAEVDRIVTQPFPGKIPHHVAADDHGVVAVPVDLVDVGGEGRQFEFFECAFEGAMLQPCLIELERAPVNPRPESLVRVVLRIFVVDDLHLVAERFEICMEAVCLQVAAVIWAEMEGKGANSHE